jgi:hypothetical protein
MKTVMKIFATVSGIATIVLLCLFRPGTRIFIALFLIILVSIPYFVVWRNQGKRNNTSMLQWKGPENIKDAASYYQSGVTVIILVAGACWGIYTWNIQYSGYKESLAPALEVRISACQKEIILQDALLDKDFLIKYPRAQLIDGFVSVKNVGSLKTTLQTCECVHSVKDDITNSDRDIFSGLCEVPKYGRTPRESIPSCIKQSQSKAGEAAQAKGPIVISRVYIKDARMQFVQTGRFWLTRSSVDNRPDVLPYDEIRPQAEDKFEFVVSVPEPGLYAVMFTSPLDDEELDRMKGLGPDNEALEHMTKADQDERGWRLRWDATTFVEVHENRQRTHISSAEACPDEPTQLSTPSLDVLK